MTSDGPSDEFLMFLDGITQIAPDDLSHDELVSVLASLTGTYCDNPSYQNLSNILYDTLKVTMITEAKMEYEEQGGTSAYVH